MHDMTSGPLPHLDSRWQGLGPMAHLSPETNETNERESNKYKSEGTTTRGAMDRPADSQK